MQKGPPKKGGNPIPNTAPNVPVNWGKDDFVLQTHDSFIDKARYSSVLNLGCLECKILKIRPVDLSHNMTIY